MPSGPGYTSTQGIAIPGDADTETYASDFFENLGLSVDTQLALDRGRLTTLENRIILGRNRRTAQLIITSAATWTDVCTITATSHGRLCKVDWKAIGQNLNSGATRVLSTRLVLDGVAMAPTQLDYTIPVANPFNVAAAFDHESTPAAGSHTWKLQALCATANAAAIAFGTMTVEEF